MHGVPPYEFARRARSFGRVAPSRMTARTGARSAPLRGLAVFYSSAVAINQSKRLCTKGHLAEGSFRGGSSAVGGEGVPLFKEKLLSHERGCTECPLRVCAPRKILRSYAEGITSIDGAESRCRTIQAFPAGEGLG